MKDWTRRFAGLAPLSDADRHQLEGAGRQVRLARGTRIFAPGDTPQSYVLVLDGDIRVSQMSEGGREIVLYRVLAGESCALTTSCLLGGDAYSAEAVAETDIEIVAIPRAEFEDVMGRSAGFRRFVLASFSQRITDLCRLVDEIAFQRLDVRLAHKLIELAGAGGEVAMTHQQIASELGTAREVVSRQLHELHRRGWIASGRGTVRLIDRTALLRLAGDVDPAA